MFKKIVGSKLVSAKIFQIRACSRMSFFTIKNIATFGSTESLVVWGGGVVHKCMKLCSFPLSTRVFCGNVEMFL